MNPEAIPPPLQLLKMVMGSWVAQAIGAAARLGIADHLASSMATAEELARKTDANADALHRLMRALASVGVFRMEGRKFGLNPLGEALRSNQPGSMRNIAIAETDTAHWLTWGRFGDAVRSGRSTAREALGCDAWEYYGKHPEDGAAFSRAMADISGLAVEPVLSGYDFGSAKTIVDVGGAQGALLCAMLGTNTAARGILFDLPQVTTSAREAVRIAGMAGRVEVVGGDFFRQVPAGGDLYLLKHILHDWDDPHCIDLLKVVRASMKPASRILIVEMALPDQALPTPAHLMDLNMLVMLSGRERTVDEYAALLQKAGLRMTRFVPTKSPLGLIEAAI